MLKAVGGGVIQEVKVYINIVMNMFVFLTMVITLILPIYYYVIIIGIQSLGRFHPIIFVSASLSTLLSSSLW